MNTQTQIHFSAGSWVGLILLAAFSVGLFASAMVSLHPPVQQGANFVTPDGYRIPNGAPSGQQIGDYATIQQLPQPREVSPQVNTAARDELKQQSGSSCVPCNTPTLAPQLPTSTRPLEMQATGEAEANRIASQFKATLLVERDLQAKTITCYAANPKEFTWVSTGVSGTHKFAGPDCFAKVIEEMRPGVKMFSEDSLTPTTPQPRSPSSISVDGGRYQLALFLGDDSKSQALENWFQTDAGLIKMKNACAFEIYTVNSPLYRTRFASVIAAKDFPAVLFLKPDGGHIYAAGGPMLPNSASTLLSDFRSAFELAQSVEQAPAIEDSGSGLLSEKTGYNWDQAIQQDMRLISQCDDGSCEPNSSPWQPGSRIRDLFADKAGESMEAIVWASASEIVTVIFSVVALALFGGIAWKMAR